MQGIFDLRYQGNMSIVNINYIKSFIENLKVKRGDITHNNMPMFFGKKHSYCQVHELFEDACASWLSALPQSCRVLLYGFYSQN